MARKRRQPQEGGRLAKQELRWRYVWLRRSALMSDERVRELVATESRRLVHLPIAERVGAMERFLDRRGLLGSAERLIAHLCHSGRRWKGRLPTTEGDDPQ